MKTASSNSCTTGEGGGSGASSSRTPDDGALTGTSGLGLFPFTESDFRQIAAILHADAGIYLPNAKAALVYSRLTKRLRALGLESFREYCSLIASQAGGDERQKMIAALTTNVTRFFREPHHFDDLKANVIARKVPRIRDGARLRIWSAACSDGQEPYSAAMTILSALPDAHNYDVRILATDIDSNMIAAALAGEYDEDALSAVPRDMRARWFSGVRNESKSSWKIDGRVASLVAFRELNLIGAWPMKGKFDAIFCRNVAIYFDESTQQQLWKRFSAALQPDGRLYIGHSERVTGPAADVFAQDGITTYKLLSASAS